MINEPLVNNANWQQFAGNLEQDRGLPSGMLAAVARNETAGGHPSLVNATSSAGAQGMYQFMPATAKQYNVNVSDSADSTRGAADYLQDLNKKYGDPLLAGAAYNWGPGNIDNAIKAAQGANIPTDAMSLAQHGFLPKETSAYVVKLAANLPQSEGPTPFSKDIIDNTRQSVATMAANGDAAATIVQNLSKSPVGSMIDKMLSSGVSPDDIVKQVGGEPFAKVQAAQDKINKQGFLTNTIQGGGNALGDISGGAQQLGARVTGDDAQLAALQAEQKAKEADPERIALGNTAGGMIGSTGVKALPYIAAGAATGGAGVIPGIIGQGLAGAAEGAFTPTTENGQFGKNILSDAALGAGTAGAGVGLSKIAGKVLSAGGSKIAAMGVPAVDHGAIQSELAQAVGKKLGVDGATTINQDLIHSADAIHKPMFDAAAAGNTVTIPKGFGSEMTTLTENLNTVPKPLNNLMSKLSEGDTIPAEQWIKYRSDIASNARDAVGSDRKYLGDIVNHLDDTLTNSSSLSKSQLADLAKAREYYRNLQPVESMVAKSNNSGVITPQQFATSVKTAGGTDAYARGNAPLQDLQPTIDKLGKGNVLHQIADNTGHGASAINTILALEAAEHFIPGAGPVLAGGRFGLNFLKNNKMGQKILSNTGSSMQGAGNSLASSPAMSAVIANLIQKGVGQSGSSK